MSNSQDFSSGRQFGVSRRDALKTASAGFGLMLKARCDDLHKNCIKIIGPSTPSIRKKDMKKSMENRKDSQIL